MPKFLKYILIIVAALFILSIIIEPDEEESDSFDLYTPVHDEMQDAMNKSTNWYDSLNQ